MPLIAASSLSEKPNTQSPRTVADRAEPTTTGLKPTVRRKCKNSTTESPQTARPDRHIHVQLPYIHTVFLHKHSKYASRWATDCHSIEKPK